MPYVDRFRFICLVVQPKQGCWQFSHVSKQRIGTDVPKAFSLLPSAKQDLEDAAACQSIPAICGTPRESKWRRRPASDGNANLAR